MSVVKALKTMALLTIEEGIEAMRKASGTGYRPLGSERLASWCRVGHPEKGETTVHNVTHLGLSVLFATVVLILVPHAARAQDPVKVDPQHYKVEFENAQVRVLRISYGPHEKSVMHGHPGSVAVFLTDNQVKFTLPDGKTEERSGKAGQTVWLAAGKHLPENMHDKPFEIILVELKAKPTKTPSTKTK
jgi:quercetin dioxygenase-like cupin family protein